MLLAIQDFDRAYFVDQLLRVVPEGFLAVGMCAVLIVAFFKRDGILLPTVAALGSLALGLLFAWNGSGPENIGTILDGSLAVDPFSQKFKVILYLFSMLVIIQWLILGSKESKGVNTPDFLCLILGATFGMSLMSSASNLLTIFVATEAASLPSFALAGFRKQTRKGSEASLKYVLFGAAASGIMIYGASLVYGATGTLDVGEIAKSTSAMSPLLAVGLMGVLAGVAFKLSAVPLHFWCPDVFESAPMEVTTFLSVASKGAAICMLARFCATLGYTDALPGFTTSLAILGGFTAFWGNFLAYHQTNLRRMLAYSSIAHAGYMIIACSVLTMAQLPEGVSQTDIASSINFYILVYMFMNLSAFTILGAIAHQTGSEEIEKLSGLAKHNQIICVLMAIALLSLFGMPGLGGFTAKFIMSAAVAEMPNAGMVLVAILLINTLISFFYYWRPIKIMVLGSKQQEAPAVINFSPLHMGLSGFCTLALLVTGLFPNLLIPESLQFSRRPLPNVQAVTVDPAQATKPEAEKEISQITGAQDASQKRLELVQNINPVETKSGK